jgi:putative ABC transport system permease protein
MSEWRDHVRSRLVNLRLDAAREAEIVDELSQHLDERYEELRRDGVSEAEARRLAVEELLEPEALGRSMRPLRQANTAAPLVPGAPRYRLAIDLWQDLRYAVRMLGKERAFAAAAILTLALGIGANSAIFALVDTTLLRPLPFPNAERLVLLLERSETSRRVGVAPPNLADWGERNRSFEVLGGIRGNVGSMVMGNASGVPENVPRQWATAEIFDALGVEAIVGRTFRRADDVERARVVVLSEAFWRTRFNADPGVVGRTLQFDGEGYTVVGVAPESAQLLGRTSIWALTPILNLPPGARRQNSLFVIGRLKRGVTLDAANANLSAVADGLAREFPTTNAGRGVALEPLRDAVFGADLRATAKLFLAVVGFVLLLCCANVANLLLTRATVRQRELAIRSALGADRRRIVRQLLTESLVLAAAGGALGLLAGAAILDFAPSVIPPELLPSGVRLAIDGRVALFCGATSLLVGVLFGLFPAWQATRFSSAQVIAAGGRATTGRGGRARSVLVAGQVATAVVLLVGAGLLLRTLLVLASVDRGYRADDALTMMVDPGPAYRDEASLLQFYDAVGREVSALPGVRGVAWATTVPMGVSYQGASPFEIVGDPLPEQSQRPRADYQIVSPSYFATLDLPVLAGRAFDERDRREAVGVCIVNEAFVRNHLGRRSPIGTRVAFRGDEPTGTPIVREIVGVVRQVKARPNETADLVQIYVPLAQHTPGDIFMLVRPASGDAEALGPSVRAALARVDKTQLVGVRSVLTLDDVASLATARHRFRAILVVAFALLALLLAMVGLFGVLAYAVQQRLRDFAVRRVFGATGQDVLRHVAGSAAPMLVSGALLGLALSVALGRLLSTMLFGVAPLDPLTFATVTIVLILTGAVAALGPALRAARIDPAEALRGQ